MTFECECGSLFETTWDQFFGQGKHKCNMCNKRVSKGEQKVGLWLINNGLTLNVNTK